MVTIPPGGKTDALVETSISWEYGGMEYKTRGLDADQTEAAIKATMKMLNIIANHELKTRHYGVYEKDAGVAVKTE